jgi:hypothetical protein
MSPERVALLEAPRPRSQNLLRAVFVLRSNDYLNPRIRSDVAFGSGMSLEAVEAVR